MTELRVVIPGEPVAQGRGRAVRRRGRGGREHVVVLDPPKSQAWKRQAWIRYRLALDMAGLRAPLFPEGPVEMEVLAVFSCPPTHHRKRAPAPRAPKTSVPDCDNVLKAVKDAAKGVLWTDDAQVARVVVEKWRGAQGEDPRVEIIVRRWSA